MSKQIDERVVEMTFDNSDFEKNVRTSMSTIDKLKQALNFKGAEKGLENVNAAAKRVNFSGVSSAVDAVKVKFDALQVAGTTALVNITNAALNTGKQMASAFTIQPITQGFSEYETQLNSVQTIMANTASKGTTIEQVTDALNELNTYADKTIYNFTEMTRNIGTFTAAGVDLDKSVASIKGIANLAAMSGSSSVQASTAMYQLSQAIAAGRVSLMDWNSVVNAGMGGEQFQEALKRTARVMGTGVDAAIEKYGSFRESLTKGQWLTTEVLTETLKQISGAYTEAELMQQGYTQEQARAIAEMSVTAEEAATKVKTFTQLIDTMKEAVGSGWAQTWQTVFGDFYEARDFWTSISDMFGDMIGSMSDARNTLLEGAFESSWEQIRGKIEATGGSLDLFDEKIREVVTEAGINYDDLIAKTGDLFTAIQDGAINMEAVQEAFIRFAIASGDVNKNLPEIESTFASFSNTVKDIWKYGFDDSTDKIEELTRAGYDYAEVGDLVKKITEGQELSVNDLTEAQLKAIGVTDEQLTSLGDLFLQLDDTDSGFRALFDTLSRDSGRVLLFESIRNVLDAIIRPLGAIREAFHNIFGLGSTDIYNFLASLEHFTSSLVLTEESADKVRRAFEGIFAIISIVTSTIGGAFSAAFTVVQTILDDLDIGFLDFAANLGDSAVALADFIKSSNPVIAILQAIAHAISSAIKPVSEFVSSVGIMDFIPILIENLTSAFSGLRDNIVSFGSGVIDIVADFIDSLMNLDEITFEDISAAFGDFVSNIQKFFSENFTGIFDPIVQAASNVAGAFGDTFTGVMDVLNQLKNVVVTVVDTIIDKFSGTGIAGIFAIVFGAGVLAVIAKFLDAITSLRSPMDALTGLLDTLSNSFADFAKAKSFQVMSVGVRNIAIAVAILAASVYALAQVPIDQLVPAAGAIVAISIALAGVTAALGYFAKGDASIKLGGSIAAIGAGVLMIASAFAVLNGIDTDSLIQSGAAIISIMVVLTGLGIAMQKFGGKGTAQEFGGPALQIIALAAAVRIVADAVKQMSEIDQGSMTTAIFGMITVFGALTALMGVMNKFGGGLANASGLLVTVIGLQAFIMVVQNLANFDASGIIANLPNIIILFGMITALMAASSLAGANSAKGGAALILISGAMLIMTQVIQIIGNMDEGVISRGMSAITGIGLIFTMLIAITSLAGENAVKAGASMLIMATAIIVLTGAIALLGSMDESTLAKGTAVVAAISVMFAGLIAVTHFAGDASKTIIKLTIAIGALVAMVVLLSFLDPARVVPATACITALMVAFGAMTALTKFAGKANSGMAVALGVIVVLAGVVAVLGGLPMDGAIQASISIGILMTAMSAALVAMGYAGNVSTTAMAAMGILTGVVAALAVILGALTALDVAPSIETSASISIMLLGMTAVLAALSAIGPTANLALSALGPLLAVIGVLGAVFTALGGLNNLLGGGISDAIAGAIPIMENIGKAIGSFIGGIVGGVASGAMSALPQIASSINAFWMGIQPFVLGMKVMGPDALNGVKTLVEMLAMITGANILESLGQFFGAGNSMDKFAVNIVKFGAAISAFSAVLSVGNFNGETVTAAANAGKALAEMQNTMQGSGGLFQMFEGTKDMGAFGEQLKEFGSAIVEFSKVVSAEGAINSDAITNAANAGKVMAELQKSLAQNGDGFSVVKFFAGEQNLETFGEQIVAFGEAMVDFSSAVSKEGAINSDAVNNAANAGKIMAELQKSIGTNTTSVFSLFAGEQNLEHFGTQIKMFGEGIVAFSNAITENGGIDTDAITKAQTAGIAMAELANSLPNYAFGSGKLDLTGFGYDLTDYAGSIVRMSNQLASVDMTKISLATTIAQRVTDVITTLQGVDESVINKFWVLDNLATSLSNFSSSITGVDTEKISLSIAAAKKVVELIQSLSGISGESVSGFSAAVSALGQVTYNNIANSFSSVDFGSIGTNIMGQIAQGLTSGMSNVQSILSNVLSLITRSVSLYKLQFQSTGSDLASSLAEGIQNGAQSVVSEVSSMLTNAKNALNGYESAFYTAGSNLALGFANGIRSSAYAARAAATAMATAAVQAAQRALDEHSPSKVMRRIGEYAGQGFVLGVGDFIAKSEKAGEKLAQGVIDGASLKSLYESFGDLEGVYKNLTDLSKKYEKQKKKDTKTTEEETEETSKLSEVLSTVADDVQKLIDRRNDLRAIDKLLSGTAKLSRGFVAELLNSSGKYAGAISEMTKLTTDQLNMLSAVYDESKLAENMEELADTLSESLQSVYDGYARLGALQKLFSRGINFGSGFIAELIDSSGQYADALVGMADLTEEQLKRIEDAFNEQKTIDNMNNLIDTVSEMMMSIQDRYDRIDALNTILSNKNLNLSEEFIAELKDSSGEYADILTSMVDLTEEQIKQLEAIYNENIRLDNVEKVIDKISELEKEVLDLQNFDSRVNSILDKAGGTVSNAFANELKDADGEFADFLDAFEDATGAMIKKVSDLFTLKKFYTNLNTLTDAIDGNHGLSEAFEKAETDIEGFAVVVTNLDLDMEEIIDRITEFADKVSDGFNKIEVSSQTGLSEFMDNIKNNLIYAKEWATNLDKVIDVARGVSGGMDFINKVLEGGIDQYGRIIAEMANLSDKGIENVINTISGAYSSAASYGIGITNSYMDYSGKAFENVGEALGIGLTSGITTGVSNTMSNVNHTINTMCSDIETTTKSYFGIHSPSKLMASIGKNIVAGLSNGITNSKNWVIDAVSTINSYLSDVDTSVNDMTVKITPVIDYTEYDKKLAVLSSDYAAMLSPTTMNSLESVIRLSGQNGINDATKRLADAVDRLENKVASINPDNFGVTYQQINNSPTPLSTATIYRQTRNQISLAKNRNGKSFNN